MKKKPVKVITRLLLVITVLGFLFWGAITAFDHLKEIRQFQTSLRQTDFGISLPRGYTVHGIDVSHHQGIIDWQRVDSMHSGGVSFAFVFVKATEGITRQDPKFGRNWKELERTGLRRGAYHFFYPSRNSAAQAGNFIRTVKMRKGDLPPVVDIEHSNGKSRKHIRNSLSDYIKRIENHYKIKPIIYTNHSFYKDYLEGNFNDNPIWISYYTNKKDFLAECDYPWLIWQHSESGKVDGIRGKVDFNVFNGSLKELDKLRIP